MDGGLGIGLIQPRRDADAAGDGIQFGDTETIFGQQQVVPDDARRFAFERGGALEVDQFRRLAKFQPARDPLRLLAFHAFAVKEIDRAIKLQEHAAERIQFLREFFIELERGGGDAPLVTGKQTLGGHLFAHELRGFGGDSRVRCNWDGFHARTLSAESAIVKNERKSAGCDDVRNK